MAAQYHDGVEGAAAVIRIAARLATQRSSGHIAIIKPATEHDCSFLMNAKGLKILQAALS